MKPKQKTTEKLPKKNNASDGKKAHLDSTFYKVGKIRYGSWANKALNAYDIIVYERELVHIQNEHGAELETVGFTAFDFVKFIVSNFNEIYEGNVGRKMLVVKREKVSNYAVVELSFDEKKKFYKIKTALSVKTKRLISKKLLCANVR